MRRRHIELGVGLGLLLGPLGYALTLQPEVIEVVRVEEAPVPAATNDECVAEVAPAEVAPEVAPAEVAPEPEVAPAPSLDLDGRLQLAFANEAGLVLSTDASLAWGTGRLRAHAGPGAHRAAKRADLGKVPEALWAQRGRTFDVYGASGKLCTARLGELSILAQHNGPSLFDVFHGQEAYEDGAYERFEQHPPSAKATRAKVWSSVGEDSAWLVAELVSDSSCEGALWARDAELPPPALLHRVDGPSPVIEQRIAAHEASPKLAELKVAYQEWLEQYPEERHDYPEWSTIEREHPATARAWLDESGAARLVELEFGYTEDGCGDFAETSISSVDLVTDGGFEPTPHETGPLAVFDADLDGQYELLYPERVESETPELSRGWSIYEEFYCPC